MDFNKTTSSSTNLLHRLRPQGPQSECHYITTPPPSLPIQGLEPPPHTTSASGLLAPQYIRNLLMQDAWVASCFYDVRDPTMSDVIMGCEITGSSPPIPFFFFISFSYFFCFFFLSLYLNFYSRFSYYWRFVGRQFITCSIKRVGEKRTRHAQGDNLADCDLSIYLFLAQVFFIHLSSFLRFYSLSLTHVRIFYVKSLLFQPQFARLPAVQPHASICSSTTSAAITTTTSISSATVSKCRRCW